MEQQGDFCLRSTLRSWLIIESATLKSPGAVLQIRDGQTSSQLNQKSLGRGPRRLYFLFRSSGDSSVQLRLKTLDHLGEDMASEFQEQQDCCISAALLIQPPTLLN